MPIFCRVCLVLIALLPAWTLQAEGAALVCGDAQSVKVFQPVMIAPQQGEPACFVIPDDEAEAQTAVWGRVTDRRHLRVVNGRLVTKTAEEIAGIAQDDHEAQRGRATTNTELTVNDLCTETEDYLDVEKRIWAIHNFDHVKMVLIKLARCLKAMRQG